MRRIRFVAFALISFIAALVAVIFTPSTFLNRAIATALCTVFSFNSTVWMGSLAQSSERLLAANPPVEERTISDGFGDWLVQRSREFDDDKPVSTPPSGNPNVPPYPQQPSPNIIRPEFDTPNSRQQTQSQARNYPFTGVWWYEMHSSPSDVQPFYSNFLQITHNGNEYIPFVCESNCNIGQLQRKPITHVAQKQSLTADYQNLTFEILPSTNNEALWGKFVDKEQRIRFFFRMLKISNISASPAESAKIKIKSGKLNSTIWRGLFS